MEITTITIPFLFNMSVNCYLVRAGDGYILIDTGTPQKRSIVEEGLEAADCRPGDLKLIVLTHGDSDHAGNCAYLCQKFGAKSAMHTGDLGMVEQGDMFWNRNQPNFLMKAISSRFFSLKPADQFTPDITLDEEDDLTEYGFDIRVVHIPGHSMGSIGLLTGENDLFCGDLLGNTSEPGYWVVMDDPPTAEVSARKLKGMEINTVYPGHGKPFQMEQFELS